MSYNVIKRKKRHKVVEVIKSTKTSWKVLKRQKKTLSYEKTSENITVWPWLAHVLEQQQIKCMRLQITLLPLRSFVKRRISTNVNVFG